MPIDTFSLPGQQQTMRQENVATQEPAPGHYERPGFEADQQRELFVLDPNHRMTDDEIQIDAMLTREQLALRQAEAEARIDLSKEEYDPSYFDGIDNESRKEGAIDEAQAYYAQQREVVATPHAQETVGVSYEAAQELTAHPEQNLPRLSNVGKLVVASRSELVLTA